MASLQIYWPGYSVLIDCQVVVRVDNVKVAQFSFVNGGEIELSVTEGPHVVAAKMPIRGAKQFNVELHDDRRYRLELVYSTMWGNFSNQAKFIELATATSLKSDHSVTTDNWMVSLNGQQFGPYDTQTLHMLVATKQMEADAMLVWMEGMSTWMNYNQVPQLVAGTRSQTSPQNEGHVVASVVEQIPIIPIQIATEEKVDLNNASLDELLGLPALNLNSAVRLVSERQSRLGFRSVEEIGQYLTLSPHQVERINERATLSTYVGIRPVTSARGRVVDF